MEINKKQVVQPEVSRAKFDSEIAEFRNNEDVWRKQGVVCLKAEFPIIQLAFIAHQLKPSAIAFAVAIDFTNYDVEPPSLVFINPLTGQRLIRQQLDVSFIQKTVIPIQFQVIDDQNNSIPNTQDTVKVNGQEILVGQPGDIPFLCIPGVREYHDHPYHTGDAWLLYRTKGEGRLSTLIGQLYSHSIPFIKSYSLNFIVGIRQDLQ